ncbi:hypothetical protein GCM10027299_30740 [Larkinella ripae]
MYKGMTLAKNEGCVAGPTGSISGFCGPVANETAGKTDKGKEGRVALAAIRPSLSGDGAPAVSGVVATGKEEVVKVFIA